MQELKGNQTIIMSPNITNLLLFSFISGNIRVYCRVRPLSEEEKARNDEFVVSFLEEGVMMVNNAQTNQRKNFEFEKIYVPDMDQGTFTVFSLICAFIWGSVGS
jgi:hypothetical protein